MFGMVYYHTTITTAARKNGNT